MNGIDHQCKTCIRIRQGYCDGAEPEDRDCQFYKRMTNADRIRQMTDEKLAQWLTFIETRIRDMKPNMTRPEMFADWFDWLKQQANEKN